MRRTGPPDITIESFINEDLRKKLNDLKEQVESVTGKKSSVSIPEFNSLVSERADRKGVYPTFLFNIPKATYGLSCAVVKKSEWDTAGTTRKTWARMSWFDEITDDDRDNGTFQGEWKKPPLEFDTTYYVVFLKAFDILEEVFATNPEKTSALPGNGTPGSGTHLFEWTTRKVFPANPPAPDAADIITNKPYLDDGINGNARVEFRLWGSADHTAFVEDLDILTGAIWLLPFEPDGSGNKVITANTKAQRYDTEAEYETAIEFNVPTSKHKAIKVIADLPLGQKYRWWRSMLVNPAGKGKSTLTYADPPTNTIPAGVDFWAGGKVADSDADIPEPTITVVDQIDKRHTEIQINFTQAATPVLLKKMWVEISYDGGTNWKVVYQNGLRDEENFDVTGAHSIKTTIKHKVNHSQIVYKLRATLVGIGKVGADQHSPFKITATPTEFTPTFGPPIAIPGAPSTGDVTRVINSDTEEPDERVTVTIRSFTDAGGGIPSATPMSFRDGNVTHAFAVLVNASGTEKFRIGGPVDPQTATSQAFVGLVPLGETLYWKKTIFTNGDGRTVTSSNANGGLGETVASSIARATSDVDVPDPSFQTVTQIDNKHTRLTIRFTQPATPIFLKKLIVDESLDAGANYSREKEVNLKSEEGYHTTGVKDVIVLVKHPANQANLRYRVQILAVGGFKSDAVVTSATTTSDVVDDTAAPGGTLIAPVVVKLKRTGLKINLTAPTTNNLKLRRANVYIANGDHSTATLWINASTLSSTTGVEANGSIPTNPTGGVVIPITRETLALLGSTITVYATWTNDAGTSGFSSGGTYALSGGEYGESPIDSAGPGAVGSLSLAWTAKKGYVVKFTKPTTNIQTLQGYKIVFFDNGGTNFMDPMTGALNSPNTEVGATIFHNSEKLATQIRKNNLASQFSSGVKVKVTPVNIVNGVATDGTSTTSGLVAAGDDIVNTNDSVQKITAGAVAIPGKQVLPNADLLLDDGTANNLAKWKKWNGSTPINTNLTTITNATSTFLWQLSDHSLKTTGTGNLTVNLKKGRVLPGEKLSFSLHAKSDGTPSDIVLFIYLQRQSDAANNLDNASANAYATVALTGLNSTWKEFGTILKIKDSPSLDNGSGGYEDQWLNIQITGTYGGSNIWFDRFMLNRGSQPAIFTIREDEEGLISVLPSAVAAESDANVNIIGVDGGWFETNGTGGYVDRMLL